jgi:hypothetical protein
VGVESTGFGLEANVAERSLEILFEAAELGVRANAEPYDPGLPNRGKRTETGEARRK